VPDAELSGAFQYGCVTADRCLCRRHIHGACITHALEPGEIKFEWRAIICRARAMKANDIGSQEEQDRRALERSSLRTPDADYDLAVRRDIVEAGRLRSGGGIGLILMSGRSSTSRLKAYRHAPCQPVHIRGGQRNALLTGIGLPKQSSMDMGKIGHSSLCLIAFEGAREPYRLSVA
jgi:hypothetical protein